MDSMISLRRLLAADAASCFAAGLLMAAAAGPLADLTGLPPALLRGAGLVLLPWAAFVGLLARRSRPARGAVWAVVALNAVWTVDSLLLLASGWGTPNRLGVALVLGQAAVGGGFALLQALALPRRVSHLQT